MAERLSFAPFFSCGACALWQFWKIGITSVKIAGRGRSTELKIAYVRFIKKSLDALKKSVCEDEFYREVRKLFLKTFKKNCRRIYCYYPHFFNN